MRVYKRKGSPYWQVDLTDENGKRVRKALATTSEREAKVMARKLQAEIEAESAKPGDPITLDRALDAYVAYVKTHNSEGYHRNIKSIRAKLTAQRPIVRCQGAAAAQVYGLPGDKPIHLIVDRDISKLVEARVEEGTGRGTIRGELATLKAAVTRAKKMGYKAPDTSGWESPTPKDKLRYLSVEEFEAVYAELDPNKPGSPKRWRESKQDTQDILVGLAFTGARWGELANLTWDRVNMTDRTIRLYASKTNTSRVVPIVSRLYSVLERRLASRCPKSPYVFPAPGGTPRVNPPDTLAVAFDAVGINRPDIVEMYGKATAHSLRHTYASWLVQNGADIADVQRGLGHANIQQTMRYAHLSEKKTLSNLASALGSIGA